MRIMDHLMSRPLLTFLNSFFKLKDQIWHIGRSKHVNQYKFRFFFIIVKKKIFHFFSHFPTSHMENHRWRSDVRKFSRIILKCGKDIHSLKISDEFDYGDSALLNMRIMDHLKSQAILAFLDSFFTFGTSLGLIMLFKISSGFYHNH